MSSWSLSSFIFGWSGVWLVDLVVVDVKVILSKSKLNWVKDEPQNDERGATSWMMMNCIK
eukprot:scaffold30589_cov67-Skeletonema_dohrnii-CCMP3373.AAC.2